MTWAGILMNASNPMLFHQMLPEQRVHVPRAMARAVLERDRHACYLCGVRTSGIDHVVPVRWGGETVLDNLAACCNPCNRWKGNRFIGPADWAGWNGWVAEA